MSDWPVGKSAYFFKLLTDVGGRAEGPVHRGQCHSVGRGPGLYEKVSYA